MYFYLLTVCELELYKKTTSACCVVIKHQKSSLSHQKSNFSSSWYNREVSDLKLKTRHFVMVNNVRYTIIYWTKKTCTKRSYAYKVLRCQRGNQKPEIETWSLKKTYGSKDKPNISLKAEIVPYITTSN
jgi:hypothetical protein